MHKAKSDKHVFNRNVVVLMVAMAYSIFAIYTSGQEAVFGAMIVMAIAYVMFGFIANRFDDLMNVASTDTAT
jgi:putrescine:ornithine antiporter